MVVSDVLVHVDCFIRLACLNELLLSCLIVLLILVIKGLFQMAIPNLMLGMLLGQSKGLVELIAITEVFDHRVNQVHFQQHFYACLRA